MAFYDRKYVWGSPEWERLSEVRDRRLALVSKGRCIGQAIAAYAATEDEITFTLANGWALVFTAASQCCCDASWFVLSDIDCPADLIGATLTGLRHIDVPYDENAARFMITLSAGTTYERETTGSLAYGFNVDTTRGTYHARMANDGGDSGCYSGELEAGLYAPKKNRRLRGRVVPWSEEGKS